MYSNLEQLINQYIEGKPFELIIYKNSKGIQDAMTTDLSEQGINMEGVSESFLKSQLTQGEYTYGEVYYNSNNIFPHMVVLSNEPVKNSELFYEISKNHCRRVESSTLNRTPNSIEIYSNPNTQVKVNYYID